MFDIGFRMKSYFHDVVQFCWFFKSMVYIYNYITSKRLGRVCVGYLVAITLRQELRLNRRHVNREAQTVNCEAGKQGAVETGVKSGPKKAHKPWIRGKKGAQTVN